MSEASGLVSLSTKRARELAGEMLNSLKHHDSNEEIRKLHLLLSPIRFREVAEQLGPLADEVDRLREEYDAAMALKNIHEALWMDAEREMEDLKRKNFDDACEEKP